MFARLVQLIKNKASITEEIVDKITEIVNDPDKAQEVYSAARTSMGMLLAAPILHLYNFLF